VGGTTVFVGGTAVAGTFVGGTFVAVGGTAVLVGGTFVAGTAVGGAFVGGTAVAVAAVFPQPVANELTRTASKTIVKMVFEFFLISSSP
jgi:hypothetical protein